MVVEVFKLSEKGLDKVEELTALGEDLKNISLELKNSTNQNRRIARHTSDISHRLGMRKNSHVVGK